MAAEDFADFTDGLRDATDGLGDFTDALGDASEGGMDLGDPGEAVKGGGGALPAQLAQAAVAVASGGGLKEIAGVLMGIASAGLPPGVGTVLTKAVGSKL